MTNETDLADDSSHDDVARALAAAVDAGLGLVEESALRQTFMNLDAPVLVLGVEAGRVSLGLGEIGYTGIMGLERRRELVTAGRNLALKLELPVPFRVLKGDTIPFENGLYAGIYVPPESFLWSAPAQSQANLWRELARLAMPSALLLTSSPSSQLAPGDVLGWCLNETARVNEDTGRDLNGMEVGLLQVWSKA